jgi:hypothetical protein
MVLEWWSFRMRGTSWEAGRAISPRKEKSVLPVTGFQQIDRYQILAQLSCWKRGITDCLRKTKCKMVDRIDEYGSAHREFHVTSSREPDVRVRNVNSRTLAWNGVEVSPINVEWKEMIMVNDCWRLKK